MGNEMKELGVKTSKYDILSGLVISLIILYIFSFNHAMVYLLGVIVAVMNFLISIYAYEKWFLNNSFLFVISTIVRITVIPIIIIPFRHDTILVVTYVAGFTAHFVNLSYCRIRKKGSE